MVWESLSLDTQESHTGTINMDSFHVQTVKNFVQFMYTGDYNNDDPAVDNKGSTAENASNTTGRENSTGTLAASAPVSPLAASILKHVRANCIGDYYKVDGLVSLANERVKQLITYPRHAGEFCSVLLMAADEAAGSTGDKGLQEILGTAVGERIEAFRAMGLLDLDHFRGMGFESDLSIKVLQKSSRFCNWCSRYQDSSYY